MEDILKRSYIILFFIMTLVILVVILHDSEAVIRETVCIPRGEKELVVFDIAVIHDGKVFPLRGEKRDGCLLLHDINTWDADDNGILEPFKWGQFVEPSYDHCCTGGG